VVIHWDDMQDSEISDILWLSQVFENVNIADTLEIALLSNKLLKPLYLVVTKKKRKIV